MLSCGVIVFLYLHVTCMNKYACFNSLPPGKMFMLFCRLLILLSKSLFQKILSGIPSECQTYWFQIGPDFLRCIGPDLGPNCLQMYQ